LEPITRDVETTGTKESGAAGFAATSAKRVDAEPTGSRPKTVVGARQITVRAKTVSERT
jgi:hypothetical protein